MSRRGMRSVARSAWVAAVALLATQVHAQGLNDRRPPQLRIIHRNTLAIRVNPLGLLYEGRFALRSRLYKSDSPALRDNFLGFGLAPGASPAFGRVGIYAELQPLSVLGFWAVYEWVGYFGTFNLMQSFPSASSNFSDREIAARGSLPASDPQRGYPTSGSQLTLGATFQVRLLEHFVLRSSLRVVRADMKVRAGDRVFFDQLYDVLVPNRGWYLTNDVDAWFYPRWGFLAGLRYTVTAPFYSAEHFDSSEVPSNQNVSQRLGPMFGYTFHSTDGRLFNNPTVLLIAQWWLQHRYRRGQETSAALPMLALAFQVTGDFLPLKDD